MSQSEELRRYWEQMAYEPHDLSTCESEPLQFCGAIQGHGQLLIWDVASQLIIAASENCEELYGSSADTLIGQNVELHLPGATKLGESDVRNPREVQVKNVGQRVVSYHFLNGLGYAELEPSSQTQVLEHSMGEMRRMIYSMESRQNEVEVCQIGCDQLRSLIDFERIMVYRFEPNWDGQVVAESIDPRLDPFLGLFYPASDIPPQARQLYLNSRYRLISDVRQPPIPIVTRPGLSRAEVDLSLCSLRASSPIHIEYLINMGVRSSFSVPIKVDGELWGLISCHHGQEARIPFHHLRAIGEMAAQVISGRVSSLRNQRRLQVRNSILELSHKLLAEVTHGRTAVSAFQEMGEQVLALTGSQGAFVRMAGQECRVGSCPEPEFVDQLWSHLRSRGNMTMWRSECLVEEGLPAHPLAAGAMAVPFSLGFDDLLIWFRPEHQHEVSWGGHPTAGRASKLEPRQSFAAWTEQVRNRSRKWSETDEDAAQYLLFNFVQGMFENASDLARANSELERLTRAKDEFIGLISHELRTPLGVIVGWLEILRDMQHEVPALVEPLDVLERNAKMQVNLVNDLLDISRITSGKLRINPQAGVDVCGLVRDVVSSLLPTARARGVELSCECEEIRLTVDPERLRQILWNLVSNALKFTPRDGTVRVVVDTVGAGCRVQVIDNGIGLDTKALHAIFERFTQVHDSSNRTGGLGLGLSIVRSLVELHGGQVEAHSAGPHQGSTFTVTLPIYSLSTARKPDAAPAGPEGSLALKNWRILVAEDQPDAASALAYLLRRQGARVELASNGVEALELLHRESFDVLLSDIGMPESDGYDLIQRWRAAEAEQGAERMPAIALTAYASSADRVKALEMGFNNHLPKPVDRHELLTILKRLR